MILNDSQAEHFKEWLTKKLDDVDVETDILVDYVVALFVRDDTETPESQRSVYVENLKDFLQDDTEAFVDSVISALTSRSYDPTYIPPPSAPRKRTFGQRDDDDVNDRHAYSQRNIKQPRRGGRHGRNARLQQPSMPMFPPGMTAQDAFNAMMAMQQAMGLPLPGMDHFPARNDHSRGGRGRGRARTQYGSHAADEMPQQPEPQLDPEEIARRQEEAQKRHEENSKARAEADKQKQDIAAKLQAMDAERKRMQDLLARKSQKPATAEGATTADPTEQKSEQTKALEAQLAKLKAEAESLGIDSSTDHTTSPSWQQRGGYRGRAAPPYRGRGSARAAWSSARGGAVKRLDNRPRTVAVIFPSDSYNNLEEAMRQYMLFADHLEHATLSKHPDRDDAAMVAFEERYRAENFISKARSGIPNVGQVETAWMANPVATTTPLTFMQPSAMSTSADITMDGVQNAPQKAATDLDMAEDEHWD